MDSFNWFFKIFKEKPRTHDSENTSQESKNDRFRNSSDIPISDGFSTVDNSFDTYQNLFSQMDEMLLKMLSYSSIDHENFYNGSLKKKTPREELLRDPNEVIPFFSFQNEDYDNIDIFSNDTFKKKTPREELLRDPNEALPFSGFQNKDSSVLDYELESRNFTSKEPQVADPWYSSTIVIRPGLFGFEMEQIAKEDIDQVSTNCPQLQRFSDATPEHHFFKKFSSIRRVHLPDGIVEEHHVTSDSEGNYVTTLRRSVGDKTHEVITHSDNKGIKETVENFKNLDENEVLDFDKRLQSFKNDQTLAVGKQLKLPPTNDVYPPPGDSSYLSLFKKFFGK